MGVAHAHYRTPLHALPHALPRTPRSMLHVLYLTTFHCSVYITEEVLIYSPLPVGCILSPRLPSLLQTLLLWLIVTHCACRCCWILCCTFVIYHTHRLMLYVLVYYPALGERGCLPLPPIILRALRCAAPFTLRWWRSFYGHAHCRWSVRIESTPHRRCYRYAVLLLLRVHCALIEFTGLL